MGNNTSNSTLAGDDYSKDKNKKQNGTDKEVLTPGDRKEEFQNKSENFIHNAFKPETENGDILLTINNLAGETTAFTIQGEAMSGNEIKKETESETVTNKATLTTRRLPTTYMGTTRPVTTPSTSNVPLVINHNMNLQTALIINTLSKVLPNVPQSRLKNQPRLENVGSGVTFHQEELFIFHTTLTELQNILDKSLRRGGLPTDLMISIYAAKEHNLVLIHLFYRLVLQSEYSAEKSVTISNEDSRTFAKHFHFLRAIFPFL